MSKRIATIAAAIAVLLTVYFTFVRDTADVSGPEARRWVEAGALLVDVRTPEEFAAGHIAGAVNIPVQQLDRRMAELPARDRPVVVYCRSGQRSRRAAHALREAGYAEVHDLGPMTAW